MQQKCFFAEKLCRCSFSPAFVAGGDKGQELGRGIQHDVGLQ